MTTCVTSILVLSKSMNQFNTELIVTKIHKVYLMYLIGHNCIPKPHTTNALFSFKLCTNKCKLMNAKKEMFELNLKIYKTFKIQLIRK